MMQAGFIKVEGARLDVQRWPGDGDPILLLHEALGAATLWRDFPERLAKQEGRPVIAWSRRGYGRSDAVSQPRGLSYLENEGRQVSAVMNALDIRRAHLFGHSDGATIALIAAAFASDRILSVMVEAPHVFVEAETVAGVSAARDAYRRTDLRERLQRHHDDADSVFDHWVSTWLDPAFRDWSVDALLPRITAPVLMIQGTSDAYATMAQLDRIQKALPSAVRVELEQCGHVPHREAPETVLSKVHSFLQQAAAAPA